MTRRNLLLLVALAALVAGCSALRIGYRHADTYFAWRADEYFDFTKAQKKDFNARLARLLQWHRYEQLPDYAEFIETAVSKGRQGLKREDIKWFVEGIKARYRIIVNHGIDDAVAMLETLSPEQIVSLQKQWDKDNRKFVRERALDGTIADRKRERRKAVLNEIADWTGHLSGEQEDHISALLEEVPLTNHLRHEDRIRRQKEFLELLKLRANRHEFQSELHAWLLDWERGRSPEYARLAEEAYEKRIDFYIAVEKVLTPEQRQRAWERLLAFAEDFRTLSKRPQT